MESGPAGGKLASLAATVDVREGGFARGIVAEAIVKLQRALACAATAQDAMRLLHTLYAARAQLTPWDFNTWTTWGALLVTPHVHLVAAGCAHLELGALDGARGFGTGSRVQHV